MRLITNDLGANNTTYEGWLSLLGVLGVSKKGTLQKVEKTLDLFQNTNDSRYYLTDSGRTGLEMLLSSLELPIDAEVILQPYTCVVVPNSIQQAGLKPRFIDIDDSLNIDLNLVEKHIKHNPKAKALIVQHNLGNPIDIQLAKNICDDNGLILIEDCAHSLGAKYKYMDEEVMVGTAGDASFFSFGRDKVISSTIGGAVYIQKKHKDWRAKFESRYSALPDMKGSRVRRSLMYILLSTWLIRPFYFKFNIGKAVHKLATKLKLFEEVYNQYEKAGTNTKYYQSKYSPKLASILLNQLKILPATTTHRHEIATEYNKLYKKGVDKNASNIRYNILSSDLAKKGETTEEAYKRIKNELWTSCGTIPGNWYHTVILPKEVDLDKLGIREQDFPVAAKMVKSKMINLPTNRSVVL